MRVNEEEEGTGANEEGLMRGCAKEEAPRRKSWGGRAEEEAPMNVMTVVSDPILLDLMSLTFDLI